MTFFRFNTSRKDRKRGASTSNRMMDPPEDALPPLTRLHIADRLRSVIDPEVGMNIVDLGLLYDLQIDDRTVVVVLTMTTPACPMSGYIRQEVGRALQQVPGLRRGVTELVWDPPWTPQMMDYEARIRRLG